MRKAVRIFLRIMKLGEPARALRRGFYRVLDWFGGIMFYPFGKRGGGTIAAGEIRKILLIRTDRVGDVVLTTPALRAVRKNFPEAVIHLLVNAYTYALVLNNRNIDKAIVSGKERIARDYDLAIAFHPGFRQNRLTWKSGAKKRIGYRGWGGGFFLTDALEDDRSRRLRHEVESALEIAGLAGAVSEDRRLEVSVTAEGEQFIAGFLRERGITAQDRLVVIHPGARQEYIRWGKDGFALAADALIREFKVKVVVTGTLSEQLLVNEVIGMMQEKAFPAVGLELTRVISLLKHSSLFIGNSTGPMHIACAAGTPVVAIFGSQHPLDSYKVWGPWSDNSVVVKKDSICEPCHPTDCSHLRCMREISAEEVVAAAKKLLAGESAGKKERG